MKDSNNFAEGSVFKHILKLAGPMIIAQLINVLYNVIDRIYIGRIPDVATIAMSGVGLCLPIISIIIAFANLFGMGGAPLCSIARGKGDLEEAEEIMANSFIMLVLFSFLIMLFGFLFKEDLLWAFGASDETFQYANDYISIYLIGTLFVLLGLGLNSFINSQGFAKYGMLTVLIGAILNIILDPLFIFVFDLGVRGAAFATVLSQMVSALWTLHFLTSKKTILKLRIERMRIKIVYIKKIISLGLAGFMVAITNSIVSIVCNSTLSYYGGDMYIAIMTIINSIREIASLPGQNIANGTQPVLGYNYGACRNDRVIQGIKISTFMALFAMFFVWVIIITMPEMLINIFSDDIYLINHGVDAIRIYFAIFFMMAFQMVGQSTAIGLGKAKQAIFFSIFRKVIIVAPLTIILPKYIGINGVFYAEMISHFIGGLACYVTMLLTIYKNLKNTVSRVIHEH